MTRTPALLAATALLSALALTACGDGTVRTGAAATFGQDRITTSTLEGYVQRALKDASAQQKYDADKAGFERDVLGRILDHDIIRTAAAKQHVTVTGGDVDAYVNNLDAQLQAQQGTTLRGAAAAVGIAEADQREFFTDLVLKDAVADKLTDSVDIPVKVLQDDYKANINKYDTVRSAHILVSSKALADNILRQVQANPAAFAGLAAKYSIDTGSKAKGGDLGFQGKGALVKQFEQAIFSNPPGSYVEVKTQFGYHVIHVIERRTVSFQQAQRDLRRDLLGQQRQAAVQAYLAEVAKQEGVHVNPRFGVWDAKTQQIVAAPSCPATDFVSPSPRSSGAPAPTDSPTAGPVCP